MPTPNFTFLEGAQSLNDVMDALAQLKRTLDFHFQGKLDTGNIRELSGWIATEFDLMSENGAVGFSSADTAANDLRIWAGSTNKASAPFRVFENGQMVATNGYFTGDIVGSSLSGGVITGALIQSSLLSYPRVELSSSSTMFRAMNTSDDYLRISAGFTTGAPDIVFSGGGKTTWMSHDSTSFSIFNSGRIYLDAPDGVYANGTRIA